jgi:hypothetical protein
MCPVLGVCVCGGGGVSPTTTRSALTWCCLHVGSLVLLQEQVLLAYQVCFDLCENDNQKFLGRLISLLPVNPTSSAGAVAAGEFC